MNGKSFSTAGLWGRICVSATFMLLHGCLHQPKPAVPPTAPPRSQSTLILEAKAEADALRAALAAERIKTAKQAASVRTAQNHASALRNREIEHLETILNLKRELSTLKSERDTIRTDRDALQQEVAQLRDKTASMPQLLKMVTQVRILETSLQGMVSSIDALSNETAQLKEEIKKQQTVAKQSTDSGAPNGTETEYIVIKRGDSLWRLARRYDTTVSELKALNNLNTDLIVTGQLLKIPASALLVDEQELVEVSNPSNHSSQ